MSKIFRSTLQYLLFPRARHPWRRTQLTRSCAIYRSGAESSHLSRANRFFDYSCFARAALSALSFVLCTQRLSFYSPPCRHTHTGFILILARRVFVEREKRAFCFDVVFAVFNFSPRSPTCIASYSFLRLFHCSSYNRLRVLQYSVYVFSTWAI